MAELELGLWLSLAGVTALSASVYRRWRRAFAYWPPAAAVQAGEGPYRSAAVETGLLRRTPGVARAATFVACFVGHLLLLAAPAMAVAAMALLWATEVAEDALLAKGVVITSGVVLAAGVHLLRSGPSLLEAAGAARPLRAANWSMGVGVVLFVLMFAVLGGAIGQREGWLCLALLTGSGLTILCAVLLRAAVEHLPGFEL